VLAATRLRAGLGRTGTCPPALTEDFLKLLIASTYPAALIECVWQLIGAAMPAVAARRRIIRQEFS
jgi:hypothetical protein